MRRAILPLALALSFVPALHAGTGRIAVTTIKALYYWSWDHYTGVEFGAPPDFSIFAIPVSEGNLDWNSGRVGTLNPETNKYEFNDLEPGTYRLDYFCYDGFFWHEPPRGLPGFTPLSPDPIINPVDLTVVDNNTTEVTVAVYKLGTLAGCARDAAGTIIPGIVVSAVSVNELPVQYCQTDRWGEYRLQSSFAVRYGHTIKFEDPSGRYFTGYYHGENVRAARQPG